MAKEEKSIERNESAPVPVAKQEKTGKAFFGPPSRKSPKAAPAQSNKSEPVASVTTETSIDNDNYSGKSATAAYKSKINDASVVEKGKSSPALDEPNKNLTPDEFKQEDTPAIQVDENTSSTTPDESKNASADESKKEDVLVIQVDEEPSSGTKVPDEADPLSVSKITSEVEQTDKTYRGLKIKQTLSMDARKDEIKKGMPTPTATDIDNTLNGRMSL